MNLHELGRANDYPTVIPSGLATFGPEEWRRRIKERIEHTPTENDWQQYRRGVELLNELRDNPFFEDGGHDYGCAVEEPRTQVEIVYAETRDEWGQRVAAMARECGGFPQRVRRDFYDRASIPTPATPSDLLYTPKATTWNQ